MGSWIGAPGGRSAGRWGSGSHPFSAAWPAGMPAFPLSVWNKTNMSRPVVVTVSWKAATSTMSPEYTPSTGAVASRPSYTCTTTHKQGGSVAQHAGYCPRRILGKCQNKDPKTET